MGLPTAHWLPRSLIVRVGTFSLQKGLWLPKGKKNIHRLRPSSVFAMVHIRGVCHMWWTVLWLWRCIWMPRSVTKSRYTFLFIFWWNDLYIIFVKKHIPFGSKAKYIWIWCKIAKPMDIFEFWDFEMKWVKNQLDFRLYFLGGSFDCLNFQIKRENQTWDSNGNEKNTVDWCFFSPSKLHTPNYTNLFPTDSIVCELFVICYSMFTHKWLPTPWLVI